jgi:exodeoxyribonuclease V gamma subunit
MEEREPFELEGLERWRLVDEMEDWQRQGIPRDRAEILARAGNQLPHGRPGTMVFDEHWTQVARFREAVRQAYDWPLVDVPPEMWEESSPRLRLEFAHATPEGLLLTRNAKTSAKLELRLWLEHLGLNIARPAAVATPRSTLVTQHKDDPEKISAKAFSPLDRANAKTTMRELLELFSTGLTQPLKFFPKASHDYATATRRKNFDHRATLNKLRWQFEQGNSFGGPGESDDPDVNQCFSDFSQVFDDEFAETALRVYEPLMDATEKVAG